MDFEYDQQKSESNKIKHGIDFEESQILWNDERGHELAVESSNESRHVLIARYVERHWSAVYTYRGNNIRIISVRRARLKEIALYDNR